MRTNLSKLGDSQFSWVDDHHNSGVEADSPTQYIDHFWGDKHHGYHVMYEHLKHGDETANEVAQFVKERLVMEEEYTKMLVKNGNKLATFLSSKSSMEPAWVLTKGTVDLLLDVHVMLVKNLQDLNKELSRYKDELTKGRKEVKQQDVIDAVNLMQTTTTCLQKSKETYNSRRLELEKLKKEPSPNAKELAKVESKLVKARDEYRSYVDKYELVRVDFEEKMAKACKVFQNHDRSHFAALQQFLVLYASHHQEAIASAQQIAAQYRESLQQLSVDRILANFAKTKGTGTERPQPAVFEDLDSGVLLDEDGEGSGRDARVPVSPASAPSSCSSSNVLPTQPNAVVPTAGDLLTLDPLDWGAEKKQPSPTASASSDSTAGGAVATVPTSTSFSSSIGGSSSRQKLSLFLPKRKKTISQSSAGPEDLSAESGGIFKFRNNRRSKKSVSEAQGPDRNEVLSYMDDAQSTASSSKSEDKQINGNIHPLDMPVSGHPYAPPPRVDEDGYTIRAHEEKEDTNWSCSSSDEEDENEMQKSKIRGLTIRPADSVRNINASVDELRDAIGHITIGRSSTFDKDPWSATSNKAPLFSQSLGGGSLKQPLRPAHTADGRFRTNFNESDFARSNAPLNFSASMGPMAGLARARPRSNTPTHNSSFALQGQPYPSMLRKDSTNGSNEWGSAFTMPNSESNQSFGESTFNLSQSTANLMQATISEQRVPVAMAVNEYSHVWFKGADTSLRTQRTFGTIMISFASSSLPLLVDVKSDIEPLQFQITDADRIKAVLPNKQLLLPLPGSTASPSSTYKFSFDRLGLANWLLAQQTEKPAAAFYNAEVVRYELSDEGGRSEPPLLLTSYWKCEPDHTDVRIDYRLNTEGPVTTTLLNLVFSTKVSGKVTSCTSDPPAKWNSDDTSLSWSVTELSRHGDPSGSLKARLMLEEGVPSQAAQTYAQFLCSDTTLSGVNVQLETSDTYHLSMVRRKVLAGKYFCEPEVRK